MCISVRQLACSPLNDLQCRQPEQACSILIGLQIAAELCCVVMQLAKHLCFVSGLIADLRILQESLTLQHSSAAICFLHSVTALTDTFTCGSLRGICCSRLTRSCGFLISKSAFSGTSGPTAATAGNFATITGSVLNLPGSSFINLARDQAGKAAYGGNNVFSS